MLFFWLMIGATVVLVGGFMGYLAWLAREVPDETEYHTRTRLNPDILRLLAIGIVILICLVAAMFELDAMYR